MRNLRLILASGLFMLACGDWSGYTGDGEFTTSGPFDRRQDYVLDLGPVENTESRYFIAGLPPAEFIFGIEVVGLEGERDCLLPPTFPLVRMRLTSSDGKVVFDIDGPLQAWGGAWRSRRYEGDCENLFVYAGGEFEEVATEEGEILSMRRTRVGPHQGWGSEFVPPVGAEYNLEVETSWAVVPGHQLRLKAIGFERVVQDGA